MAAPLMAGITEEKPSDILILGMGTGTFATQCLRYFKNLNIEGVEIDEKITDLSSKYFNLPKDINVTTYDGRAYLQAVDKKYDVIMVDAYQDITIPFQMSSVEFFKMVKDHLSENGVMVVNMNMQTDKKGNINDYLSDTIASVFENVYTVDVNGATNRELFATANNDVIDNYNESVKQISNKELSRLMNNIKPSINKYDSGNYILTDDKAGVELLGMKVIDEIIQKEVVYYKKKALTEF